MKKLTACLIVMMVVNSKIQAQDPITYIIKQAIKKVIVAVDLKIQRLQTKTIGLQNAQKVLENKMSKLKLTQITSWVQKQKDLYKNYFDELWKIKNAISTYYRIKEITQEQIALVKEYHTAWNAVRQDGHFNADEISYIGQVYSGIIDASLKNLDAVGLAIKAFTTQMTDAKRLTIINNAADDIQTNLNDLRSFNQQNILLSIQRSKDENDIAAVKNLYGL